MFNKLMTYAVSQNVPIYLCENVMCRLCGCTGNNTSYILLKESCYLVKMIKDETQVKIKEDDDYPKTVCRVCVDKVHMIQHFRSHCKKTQKVLESMFNANNDETVTTHSNMIRLHGSNENINVSMEQANLDSQETNLYDKQGNVEQNLHVLIKQNNVESENHNVWIKENSEKVQNINESVEQTNNTEQTHIESQNINTLSKQSYLNTDYNYKYEIKDTQVDQEDETMEVEWLEDEFSSFQTDLNENKSEILINTESSDASSSNKYQVMYGDCNTFKSVHVSLLENNLSKNATVFPPKILGQMKKKRVEVVSKEKLSKLERRRGLQSKRKRNKLVGIMDCEASQVEQLAGQYENLYVKLNDGESNAPLLFRLLSDNINTTNMQLTNDQHDTDNGHVIDCSAIENLNFTVTTNVELVCKPNNLRTEFNNELIYNNVNTDKTQTAPKELESNQDNIIEHQLEAEYHIETEENEPDIEKNQLEIEEHQPQTEENLLEMEHHQKRQIDFQTKTDHLVTNVNQLDTETTLLPVNKIRKRYLPNSKCNSLDTKSELSTDIEPPDMRMDRSGRVFKTNAHKYVKKISQVEYRCMICEKSFRFPFKAELHVRRHTGEKPFSCKDCGKSFITGFYLMKHERTHVTGQFICEVCGKNFREIYTLKDHQRVHLDAKPNFECTICNKTFFTKSNFDGHRMTHAEKKHICEVCGKRFALYAMMSRHRKRHGSARFKCQKCPKVLKTKEDLIQHRRRHQRNGLYRCTPCSLSFWTSKGLHMHERQMHNQ